jgi:hypothetical protein
MKKEEEQESESVKETVRQFPFHAHWDKCTHYFMQSENLLI